MLPPEFRVKTVTLPGNDNFNGPLTQDLSHNSAFFSGSDQSLIQSFVREAESVRIDSDLMKNRCLKSADAHRVCANVVANVVRAAV